METKEFGSLDTLRPHFDALSRVAYFKIVLKTVSPVKRRLHNAYRILIWFLVILYNLQHFIRVFQCSTTDEVVDTLFILLTTLNTLGKQIAFNARSARMDRIIEIINGPDFAVTKPYHVSVMKSNGIVQSRLLTLYHCAVYTCFALWTTFPIVNRVLGEENVFTGYIPFDTSSNVAFGLAVAYMSLLIGLQGYGNVTLDCTIVAFFSQARTQIQILKYDLEQLTNLDGADSKLNSNKRLNKQVYEDDGEGMILQRRLVRCVEHHKRVFWFVKEVESIFGEAMTVQFLVSSLVICMTVYKIANLNLLSAEFVSMAMYLGCMMAQLFIYCYFGTLLKTESECINQSIYSGDWLSLSPRFRRQLLVIMQYSNNNPISPTTAYIVPFSLETYIVVTNCSKFYPNQFSLYGAKCILRSTEVIILAVYIFDPIEGPYYLHALENYVPTYNILVEESYLYK